MPASVQTPKLSPFVTILFWGGVVALLIGTLWLFNAMLTPFVLGIAIAYLLEPVMRKITGPHRLPRWAGSLLILSLFVVFLLGLAAIIGPMAFRQLQMLIESMPSYIEAAGEHMGPYLEWMKDRVGDNYISTLQTQIKENAGKIIGVSGGIIGGIATGGAAVMRFGTTLVLTPIVAFFMMNEWPRIVRWVEGLYPRRHEKVIRGLMTKIDQKVSGFIRGQIMVAFVLGGVYAISLSLAGLNYGFLIGVGAGLFSIIPLVGSTLGLIVSVSVAWFQSADLVYTGIIAAIFFTGQFVEGNFLTPKLVGDSVGMHPLWILFALFAGGSLMGITGMLLAVPVAAIVGVLAGFAIERYKASPLYQSPAQENPE